MLRRYRNARLIHEKVFVITNEKDLTIEILLMRGPQWKDEHNLNFQTIEQYRDVEYDIFTVLRDKGFVFYEDE
jgi:hypothetical protein